jgi:SET domain-containing protein 6
MKALRQISPEEEIYDDHDPMPRSDLLRQHGYITPRFAKYDVVDIPTRLFLEKAKELFGLSEDELEKRVSTLIYLTEGQV